MWTSPCTTGYKAHTFVHTALSFRLRLLDFGPIRAATQNAPGGQWLLRSRDLARSFLSPPGGEVSGNHAMLAERHRPPCRTGNSGGNSGTGYSFLPFLSAYSNGQYQISEFSLPGQSDSGGSRRQFPSLCSCSSKSHESETLAWEPFIPDAPAAGPVFPLRDMLPASRPPLLQFLTFPLAQPLAPLASPRSRF